MLFILLTFLAAFSIEILGTYVSVIGLSTLFGANPIIIALAIALDAGKLVVVSLLYSYWEKLGKIMRTYALTASVITMVITSAGAAGYLSGEFQKAIIGTQEIGLKVNVLKEQQAKFEERKKQIDAQIAAIPDRYTANQKIRLMNQFKQEQRDLQVKINDIDKQLPEMQVQQISVEAKAGPILYISKAFDIPVEMAVKWVILMIIFVFDPLAVFLIVAGNFLLDQRKKAKITEPTPELTKPVEVTEPPPLPPVQFMPPVSYGNGWPSNSTQVVEEVPEATPSAPVVPPVVETPAPVPEPVLETIQVDIGDGTTVPVTPLADAIYDTIPEPVQAEPEVELVVEPVVQSEPVPAVAPVRETITMSDLVRPHSSLHDVKADQSVIFDDTPQQSSTASDYRNLR